MHAELLLVAVFANAASCRSDTSPRFSPVGGIPMARCHFRVFGNSAWACKARRLHKAVCFKQHLSYSNDYGQDMSPILPSDLFEHMQDRLPSKPSDKMVGPSVQYPKIDAAACSDPSVPSKKRQREEHPLPKADVVDNLLAFKRRQTPLTPPASVRKTATHYSQVTGRCPQQAEIPAVHLSPSPELDNVAKRHPACVAASAVESESKNPGESETSCRFDNPAQDMVCHLHDHAVKISDSGTTIPSEDGEEVTDSLGPVSDRGESPSSSTSITGADLSRTHHTDQTKLAVNALEHDAKLTAAQIDSMSNLTRGPVHIRAKLWFPAPESFPDVLQPASCANMEELMDKIDVFRRSRSAEVQRRTTKVILAEIQDQNGRLTRMRILNDHILGPAAFEEFLEEISALESAELQGDLRGIVNLTVEWADEAEPSQHAP